MFEHLTESARKRGHTRNRWMILLSTFFQFVLVGVMILLPLISTEALPRQQLLFFLMAPAPPPPPAPADRARQRQVAQPVRQMTGRILTAPVTIPRSIETPGEDEPVWESASGVERGVPGGVPGGPIGGVLNGLQSALPPPPTSATRRPIRRGGDVQAAKLISMVPPIYPPLAKQARIQGMVQLEAVISTKGLIQNLRVLSGHPLLIQAALDAVRQWRYQPTLLNGEAVEVVTTIDVVFSLSQ